MANINQIKVNDITYDIEDSTVRANLAKIEPVVENLSKVVVFLGAIDLDKWKTQHKGSNPAPSNETSIPLTNETTVTPDEGDIVVHGEKEFLYDGLKWIEFGDTSNHVNRAELSKINLDIANGVSVEHDAGKAGTYSLQNGRCTLTSAPSLKMNAHTHTVSGIKYEKTNPKVTVKSQAADTSHATNYTPEGSITGNVTIPAENISVLTKTRNGTLPTLSTDGKFPTLNPGEFPTFDPGKFPTLDPGEFPTLIPGNGHVASVSGKILVFSNSVRPSLSGGRLPSLSGGRLPKLNNDGILPSLNNDGKFPTLNPGEFPTFDSESIGVGKDGTYPINASFGGTPWYFEGTNGYTTTGVTGGTISSTTSTGTISGGSGTATGTITVPKASITATLGYKTYKNIFYSKE